MPPAAETLFEHAPCGLVLCSADGTIRRVNARFCSWLGHAAEQLVGQRRVQDLFTMGGRLFHQTHSGPLLLLQGSVGEIRLDLVHRDGHTVPMLLNAVRRLHDGVAFIELAFMVLSDREKYESELLRARQRAEAALAAHREAEAALARSRQVLELALRGARMGIWSSDLASNTVWWSRELEELFGLPEGGFGGSQAHFRSLVHDDDRSALATAVDAAVAGHHDYIVEFRFARPDGEIRWMEGRGRAIYDDGGRPVMLHGLGIDITDRKQAESVLVRQAAIFEHQSDAIVAIDLAGVIVDFNPASERMLGYRIDEVLGRPISMFHLPDRAEDIDREARAALGSQGEWRSEVVFVRKDGSQGLCESVLKPLADAGGAIYGAVSVNRDITERRRIDDQLRALNEELSDAGRRKDEFLATLAHELRNPLAPMRSELEILRLADLADPKLRRSREMLERQVVHLTHLVDDLLEVSRITEGKLSLRKHRLDLGTALREAAQAVDAMMQAAAHELVLDLPDEPVSLVADPTRLAQVVQNLLNNAAKYTPPGGRVTLRGRRDNDEAVITIADSGIGIAAEHLPRLFEMFSQLDPALNRSQGGLGIGLALVRGLTALHGGSVSGRSEGVGRGSEFVIRLPLGAVDELSVTPVPMSSTDPDPDRADGGRSVLVVDDNLDALESLAELLTLQGHTVRTAADGESAVAVAAEFRPAVVLLDIGLPRVNGYEVSRRIRSEPWGRAMRLVAVTGWGQAQDRDAAMTAGFDHHLTKPVDLAALDALLALPLRDVAAG